MNQPAEPLAKHPTPREVVRMLDTYIVGQDKAKRAVAIALRNRYRRMFVEPELKDEIAPKNILMIGPTGVGKTEISRRLAKLMNAPFLKVEASKFTEVGYVGRDVDSIIRDLARVAVNQGREEERQKVIERARHLAEERVLDLLVGPLRPAQKAGREEAERFATPEEPQFSTRERFRQLLRDGKLSQRFVEMELKEAAGPMVEIFAAQGLEELDTNLRDMLSQLMPKKSKRKKVLVPEALEMLTEEEAERLIDMQKVQKTAIDLMENSGIVFIDEIDKIAGREGVGGPDVSREGVQRDLLPLVEGTSVSTKYGVIHTDHILFIAAGAFHTSKPSDLIPEFQGRFPIRVELEALTQADFVRILSETRNALVRQYQALLATEGVTLIFEPSAIEEIAKIASEINENTENIGARRLHTVMEKLLEEVSFAAPEMAGVEVKIDNQYVISKLADIVKDRDLTRYIL